MPRFVRAGVCVVISFRITESKVEEEDENQYFSCAVMFHICNPLTGCAYPNLSHQICRRYAKSSNLERLLLFSK